MKRKNLILSFTLIILAITSCGKKSMGVNNVNDSEQIISPPGTFNLISPVNNAVCEGTINANDKIEVDFQWSDATNSMEYEINIFNASGINFFSQKTNGTFINITLDRGLEFTWNVKAINNSGENLSSTFIGSTPGFSISNHLPKVIDIDLNTEQNYADFIFQDEDGDALRFDLIIADNYEFHESDTYAQNQKIPNSTGNASEHSVRIEGLIFYSPYWLRITLRDENENQIVQTLNGN